MIYLQFLTHEKIIGTSPRPLSSKLIALCLCQRLALTKSVLKKYLEQGLLEKPRCIPTHLSRLFAMGEDGNRPTGSGESRQQPLVREVTRLLDVVSWHANDHIITHYSAARRALAFRYKARARGHSLVLSGLEMISEGLRRPGKRTPDVWWWWSIWLREVASI